MNMMGHYFPSKSWTPERIALLRQMWADGHSARAIADHLGGDFTRNSVIGKARRLGLGEHVNVRNQDGIAKDRRKGEKRRKPSPRPVVARKPVSPAPAAPVAVAGASDVHWVGIDILRVHDATAFSPGKCKWPVNDSATTGGHLFCGAQTSEGTVYCTTHQRAAHQSVPRRQNIFASRR